MAWPEPVTSYTTPDAAGAEDDVPGAAAPGLAAEAAPVLPVGDGVPPPLFTAMMMMNSSTTAPRMNGHFLRFFFGGGGCGMYDGCPGYGWPCC